jgi:hypothetical protein
MRHFQTAKFFFTIFMKKGSIRKKIDYDERIIKALDEETIRVADFNN